MIKELGVLIDAMARHRDDKRLTDLGHEMFRMYTEVGFPPDMFLTELSKHMGLSLSAKVYITSIYQAYFLDHRRKSGVQEKRLEAVRRRNREDIGRLIKTGELGVY